MGVRVCNRSITAGISDQCIVLDRLVRFVQFNLVAAYSSIKPTPARVIFTKASTITSCFQE